MKKVFLVLGLLFFVNLTSYSQEAGNRIYGGEGLKRYSSPNTGQLLVNNQFFIESSVLMNIKPDSFVVVFGIQEEAAGADESLNKVNAKAQSFQNRLKGLGIADKAVYVDFITQNRIYDYRVSAESANEYLAGFETKKTVAVKYKDRSMFEKIVNAAIDDDIFDLIKVDYIVDDFEAVRARLFETAIEVVKKKEDRYRTSLGMTIKRKSLSLEKYQAFYPGERYESYKAFESGTVRSTSYRNSKTIVSTRKSSTFFYEPLEGSNFDRVLKADGIEPLVQFTIFVQVKYDLI